jgi:predicted DNA-binding transcriptional regulator AlpA
VSDRKSYHIDQRAQDIIDKLIHGKISSDQLLSTPQLATLFSVSEAWLEQLRLNKRGPKHITLGHRCLRYKMSDVLAWLESRADARANRKDA